MDSIGFTSGLKKLIGLHLRHRTIGAGAVALLLAGGTLDLGLAVSVPLFWSRIVDALVGGDSGAFRLWLLALGGIMIIRPAVGWGIGVASARTAETVAARFRDVAASRILRQPFRAQEALNVGDVLSRTINDTNAIKAAIPTLLLQVIFDALTIVVAFVLLVRMHTGLALALLATLPLTLIYRKATSATVQRASARSREAIATTTQVFQSWFQRAPVVSLYRLNEVAVRRCEAASLAMRNTGVTAAALVAGIESFNALLVNIPALLVFMLGGVYSMRGELTVGELIAFLSLSGFFHPPLQRLLAMLFTGLPSLFPIVTRISAVLDLAPDLHPRPVAAEGITGIEIANVRIEHRADGVAPFALTVPDLRASIGEVVGISGENGSGKTTLCKLITGLYTADSGEVRMLSSVGPRPAGAGVALVPQRPICLDGTLIENITVFDPEPDLARVEQVIEEVGLARVVASLPEGVATRLTASLQLSGGELQRLGLARAFYQRAPVVLFDEPTSGLDEQMARELPAMLRARKAAHLFVVVTHSPTVLSACDRVYGMITTGRHSELAPVGAPTAAALEVP